MYIFHCYSLLITLLLYVMNPVYESHLDTSSPSLDEKHPIASNLYPPIIITSWGLVNIQ